MTYQTNAVVLSNTVNGGSGDSLRGAFGKLNTSIQLLGDYVYTIATPTAILYTTVNTVMTVGDGTSTITGNLLPSASQTYNLGSVFTIWENLYVREIDTTDLTVSGLLVAVADGGTF